MPGIRKLWIIIILFALLVVVGYSIPIKLNEINPSVFCGLAGFVVLAGGALRLCKPNWLWEMEADFWQRRTGRALTRTEWKRRQLIGGTVWLIGGLFLLL